MKRKHPSKSGKSREGTPLEKALRRAFILAMCAPFAVPFACGMSESTSGSTTTGTAGAGGNTTSSTTGTTAGAGGTTTELDAGLDAQQNCDPFEYTPEIPDDCGVYIRAPCGVKLTIEPTSACYFGLNDCFPYCGELAFNCRALDEWCVDGSVTPDEEGGVNIDCATCPGGLGRAPEGLERPRSVRGASVVGAHLARAAHLEAASVHAFRRMRRELSALGAPESLLADVRAAERDEVKHARRTGTLARRRGSSPPRVRLRTQRARTIEAIALENAVEGCVRETFGAAVAAFQAARAEDPEIASLMKEVAVDEARHAAVSWAVADWLSPRLTPKARARIRARCRATVEDLRREVDKPLDASLALPMGLPAPGQQKAILRALEEDLWPALT
ncbi:MAG: ferritin-like domain-containing protein [Polyangiaceae bacterium]